MSELLSLNKYIYTESDPINNVDPSGNTLFGLSTGQTITLALVTTTTVGYSLNLNISSEGTGISAASDRGIGLLVQVAMGSDKLLNILSVNNVANDNASENAGDSVIPIAVTNDFVPRDGQMVFRVWGGASRELGLSWTPLDPRSAADAYRDLAGLPSVNLGTFLTIGQLRYAGGITVYPGVPLEGNIGGWPEYVIPNPSSQVQVIERLVVNPPF